jgi:hypothetical protein
MLQVKAMRLPRVRFTVRRMMVVVIIIGVGLGWVAWRERLRRDARSLEEARLYGNSAVAEVRHNGQLLLVQASSATPDDTIRNIVDLLAKDGIDDSSVLRFYSWKQPSPEWSRYFKEHWPKAAVSWSGPGEDLELKSAVKQ